MPRKRIDQDYLKSMIFGIEDALVSTTGVVAGISAGSSDRAFVILAGIVTVAVEALSMGAGQYLSEKAVHEMAGKKKHTDSLWVSTIIMFISYGLAGFLPILPFFFMASTYTFVVSIGCALLGLYLLGYVKGKYLHIPPHRSAFEMIVVGGAAALIGVIVGYALKI